MMCRNILFWSVSCKNIHIMVYCAKILVKYCYMSLEYFLKPWKMRQNNELHADLASFLFNCARKTLLFGFHAEILLFFGLCRNITVPSYCDSGFLCRAFFRLCRNINFWRHIHLCLESQSKKLLPNGMLTWGSNGQISG